MSNSRPASRGTRFVSLLLGIALLFWLVIVAGTWIFDPSGLLRDRGLNPRICPEGIKGTRHRPALATNFRFMQPEVLIVGSSRTYHGIREHEFFHGQSEAFNFSLSGPSADEIFYVIEKALDQKSIKQIWIGLDYGLFISGDRQNKIDLETSENKATDWNYLMSGLFSRKAQSSFLFEIGSMNSCNTVYRDTSGFASDLDIRQMNKIRESFDIQAKKVARTNFIRKSKQNVSLPKRLVRLKQILEQSHHAKKEIRIFVPPSHPAYFEAIAEARDTNRHASWRASLKNISSSYDNVTFLDFSDRFDSYHKLPDGCQGVPVTNDCPFYDLTHFTPEIGDQIVLKLR